MSTTYAKIRATLGELSSGSAISPTNLRLKLLQRDGDRAETVFHITRRGSKPQPISEDSFNRLFGEMISLGLIDRTKNDDLSIHSSASAVIADETKFQNLLTRRINELFGNYDFKIQDVKRIAKTINYPEVRDPDTILNRLKSEKKGEKMGVERFRRLLFLLACAKQRATRNIRVFYEFN